MTGPLKRIAGAVSLLALLAGAPTAFAQTGRPWVDPPSDAAGALPPAAQSPAPSPSTAAPVTTGVPQQEKAVLPEAAEPRRENARAREPAPTGERAAANPSSPRKAAETARIRRSPTRSAAARTKATTNGPRRAMASNRSNASPNGRLRGAERLSRESVRSARVRDAVNSGLEVMSLQTIELPDGRRIDVLVRPNPRTLSRLMDQPL